MIFQYDARLGISVPQLQTDWENMDTKTQASILYQWERIRGNIPDRIKELEQMIYQLQNDLYEEDDFEKSCEINDKISELASIINDLWIWYRTEEQISEK